MLWLDKQSSGSDRTLTELAHQPLGQMSQRSGLSQVNWPAFDVTASGEFQQQAARRGGTDVHPPQTDADLDHLVTPYSRADEAGQVQIMRPGAVWAAQAPGRMN